MTINEWESTRLSIMAYAGVNGENLTNKLRLGSNWINDFYKLYILSRKIDLLIEYTPQTEADYDNSDGNINFFTVEEMISELQKINELLNTDFDLDFILET